MRLLVTHGIGFLPQCDQIVVVVEGKITEIGSYNELVDNDGAFAEFLRIYSNTDKEGEEETPGREAINSIIPYKDIDKEGEEETPGREAINSHSL